METGGPNLFPTLEPDWVDEGLTLSQILTRVGEVGSLGSSPLIAIAVSPDQKQSYRNAIYVSTLLLLRSLFPLLLLLMILIR